MPPKAPSKLASRSGTQDTYQLEDISKRLFVEELPVWLPSKKPRLARPPTSAQASANISADLADLLDSFHSKKRALLVASSRQVSSNVSKPALFSKLNKPSMTTILEDVASYPYNMVEGADYPVVEDEDVAVPMDVEFEVAPAQVDIKSVTFDETKNSVRTIWNVEHYNLTTTYVEQYEKVVIEYDRELRRLAKKNNVVGQRDLMKLAIEFIRNKISHECVQCLKRDESHLHSPKMPSEFIPSMESILEEEEEEEDAVVYTAQDVEFEAATSCVALEHETVVTVESVPKLPVKAKGKKRDHLLSTLDGGYWAAPVPSTGRKRKQTIFFAPR